MRENQNDESDQVEEVSFPVREKLQGKLLDYLIHLARKNIANQDSTVLERFDPELSASFYEYVRNHPEKADFASDEVYFYIVACYEGEVEDVLGADFLEIENEEFNFNERLVNIFEKERAKYYQDHPELLEEQQGVVDERSSRLSSALEGKMQEKLKLDSLKIDDLV